MCHRLFSQIYLDSPAHGGGGGSEGASGLTRGREEDVGEREMAQMRLRAGERGRDV